MASASAQSRKALERARSLHHRGDLAGAEAQYRAVLQRDAAAVDALHGLALLCARQGRFEEARQHVDRALGLDGARPELHFLRAEVAGALGLQQQALESYGEALALRPDYFEVLVNMADVLLQLERPAQALAHLDAAIRLRPEDVAALNNRGNALQALKRHGEALQCFDRALVQMDGHPDLLNNRASALLSLGRIAEAEAACRQALDKAPQHPRAHLNLGRAHGSQGRLEEALQCFDAALAARPLEFDAWCERAAILRELQRFAEARESLEKAVALRPEAAVAWADLGATLLYQAEYQLALNASEQALALDSGRAQVWANKGLALQFLNRNEDAVPAYEKALALDARTPYVKGRLTWLKLTFGEWQDHTAASVDILAGVGRGERASEPLELLALTDGAKAQLDCARTYAGDKYTAHPDPLWNGERYAHDRIRLAYVSGDFREHAVSYLMAGVLEQHDRTKFEVLGISIGPEESSPMASRIEAAFDAVLRVRGRADAEVAKLMRHREIDIAVDLMGFTGSCRPDIFARRPCPIQVNYLGFPATMGAGYMDYLIADHHVIPPGRQDDYAEKVVRLPDAFQANDALRRAAEHAPGRVVLGLPERALVFCSFNKSPKITPALFDAWMKILLSVDGSVLWLWSDSARLEGNLRREAATRGVDPARLAFAASAPYPEHLARLRHADLALDTLPFNGGATTSDALWSGVPVVTCAGDALAARMSGSLLHAVGMPELVTTSLDEYQALAIRLGNDADLLAATKRKLAQNRLTYPLFDTDRFRRHLEAAYEVMWRRYQNGEPPEHIRVDPSASSATSTTR